VKIFDKDGKITTEVLDKAEDYIKDFIKETAESEPIKEIIEGKYNLFKPKKPLPPKEPINEGEVLPPKEPIKEGEVLPPKEPIKEGEVVTIQPIKEPIKEGFLVRRRILEE
jgi:hypothetical protein